MIGNSFRGGAVAARLAHNQEVAGATPAPGTYTITAILWRKYIEINREVPPMVDWIKVGKSTPDKPEVTTIAAALGATLAEAFLLLFRFWAWADSHSETGTVPGSNPATVDTLFGRPGLSDALQIVGWLKIREGGLIEIPKFERFMGESAKKRSLTKERVARHRAKKKGVTQNGNAGNALPALPPSFLSSSEEESLEKEEKPKGLGGYGGKGGNALRNALPKQFDLAPEGLAQAFQFYQTPKRDRVLEQIVPIFAELLQLGASPQELLADIEGNLSRRRSEFLWEFQKRWLQKLEGGTNGKPSRGVGSGARIPTPADSIAAAEAKTFYPAKARQSGGGIPENKT